MLCNIMAYMYSKKFICITAAISLEMAKVCFSRWPPTGQNLGQMAVIFVHKVVSPRYICRPSLVFLGLQITKRAILLTTDRQTDHTPSDKLRC